MSLAANSVVATIFLAAVASPTVAVHANESGIQSSNLFSGDPVQTGFDSHLCTANVGAANLFYELHHCGILGTTTSSDFGVMRASVPYSTKKLFHNFAETGQSVVPATDGKAENRVKDDTRDLTALFSSSEGRQIRVQAGTYYLNTSIIPTGTNARISLDPGAVITGEGLLKFDNLIPYQGKGVISRDLHSFTYSSPIYGKGNIFSAADFAKSEITSPVVARFAEGEAAAPGAIAWAFNGVGVCSASNSNCWGMEIDIDNLVKDQHSAIGLMIDAAGYYPSNSAIRIQANNKNVNFRDGIVFWSLHDVSPINITGAAILMSGTKAGFALYAPNSYFTNSEIELPSLRVAATPKSINSRVVISGSSENGPGISASGAGINPARNADLRLTALGAGTLDLRGQDVSRSPNPGIFSASHYLRIKVNGDLYYLPLTKSPW